MTFQLRIGDLGLCFLISLLSEATRKAKDDGELLRLNESETMTTTAGMTTTSRHVQ